MDLEGIMHSEISQTEKDILYDLTYIWNLKRESKRERENRLEIARGERVGVGR